MRVLAVETSSAVISVAIVDEHRLLAEYILNQERNHSMKLMPIVEEVLEESLLAFNDIDVFAVAHGPGSFTGLRIGVATVKGLAQALKKPVVGVSTLDGLAFNLAYAQGLICPIMDARRAQVYTSVYRWSENGLKRLEEYLAVSVEKLIELLGKWDEPVHFCGDGIFAYRSIIEAQMGGRAIFVPPTHALQRASSIAWLALERALTGDTQTYWELQPFYLRKSQAEQRFGKR
ncbi:tRNA threonylcarbamoyladenosine biosynthesis protein TsaB [Caldicoprobacter guelmensis]|uniref:tRNA (adenosine(37)-N6)-threonylcarbamoyltransferase complex dimerization subunit type 1 TsaB n=1 Tax=Caldicoprobacter guelmensis TaxID=1170224 RepID=UPI00195E1FB3|nr:tRNA (adenosine(37)-N6)-threonylcarbamoyltransferase complex dimerization subunit type 1 TsaB [Caldicoprobacter guelmensis]MBM7583095.1 tRNA threonylcarbamoyladenosine biosynthesis protein TsaB [Caldicoprobacter guelmensis]